MAETTAADAWMTVKEAAGYLGVSEPTVFRWMREGTISYFKLGGATRFKRGNLDMVARKVTGAREGEQRVARCAVCGHGYLVAGSVRSTGKLYFTPGRTRFFVLSDSMIDVAARACPVCGHVEMFADTAKLARRMRPEEAEESQRAGEDRAD